MSYFQKDYHQFFIELAANNNKDWFDVNRKRYETSVKQPFKEFVDKLISDLAKKDKRFEGLESKDCIFRINRDIRFSKDKTPYKLFCSAVISPNGKKSDSVHGIYFEFGPEQLNVYGGIYEIDKERLEKVRYGIAENIGKFKKLYEDKEFKKLFGSILGEKNKILPADLKLAAEKEPLIYNKQWYFYTKFDAGTIHDPKLDELILHCYEVGRPIENYFNELIQRK